MGVWYIHLSPSNACPQVEIRSNKLKDQKGFYTLTFKDQRNFDVKQHRMLQLCYIVIQLYSTGIDSFQQQSATTGKKKIERLFKIGGFKDNLTACY